MPNHLPIRRRPADRVPVLLILVGSFAMWPATPIAAQVVHGRVIAVGDRSPIGQARLLLRDAEGITRAAAVSTEAGDFELRSDASGMVRLEVSHLGYANWETANFALASDAAIEVEVKLGIEAIPLEPLIVIARRSLGEGRLFSFEQRARDLEGFGGYYLTEEDIGRRPAATPSGLVVGTPGMSIRPVGSTAGLDRSVIMSGDCVARTFIDGVRYEQTDMTSVDDLLALGIIAGVEVYPRALSAPVQYQGIGNPECGVVLFWTKEPTLNPEGGWSARRIAVGFGFILGIVTFGIVG